LPRDQFAGGPTRLKTDYADQRLGPKFAADSQGKHTRSEGRTVDDISVERLARLFFMSGGLLAVVTIAAYAVTTVRRKINDNGASSSELLDNFRELHERGVLSDREFRNIKTRLAARIRAELSRSKEKG
jgi:hypothetical protein